MLVVDENPLFIDILTKYFSDVHGKDVFVIGDATHGEEAYILAHLLRPDLILHDLGLPGLRGLPSICDLRKTLPQVGIIALTLLDSPYHRTAAITAGADEVVYKGDVATNLETTIQRVCERRFSVRRRRPSIAKPVQAMVN